MIQKTTKKIALTGILAALLIGGKWALSAIPNVEIVTVLIGSFGFVFGPWVTVMATLAFVVEEALIWGFNTWVVSYFIYWPLVAVVFSFLGVLMRRKTADRRKKLTIACTVTAVVLTSFFGVLTSLVDVGLVTGNFTDFWQRFAIMYARGVAFFVFHIACNLVLFVTAFVPLTKRLTQLKQKMFQTEPLSVRKQKRKLRPAGGIDESLRVETNNARRTQTNNE
jgi:hypothetical protein